MTDPADYLAAAVDALPAGVAHSDVIPFNGDPHTQVFAFKRRCPGCFGRVVAVGDRVHVQRAWCCGAKADLTLSLGSVPPSELGASIDSERDALRARSLGGDLPGMGGAR